MITWPLITEMRLMTDMIFDVRNAEDGETKACSWPE
jgi:hypothetical protein